MLVDELLPLSLESAFRRYEPQPSDRERFKASASIAASSSPPPTAAGGEFIIPGEGLAPEVLIKRCFESCYSSGDRCRTFRNQLNHCRHCRKPLPFPTQTGRTLGALIPKSGFIHLPLLHTMHLAMLVVYVGCDVNVSVPFPSGDAQDPVVTVFLLTMDLTSQVSVVSMQHESSSFSLSSTIAWNSLAPW